jgi:cation diffusion facilitator CzcD-associated flavoprotein CzcO
MDRIGDTKPPPRLTELAALIAKTADQPVDIPKVLPAQAPKLSRPRYEESSVYPYMETNVDALAMSFTQENIPVERSAFSLAAHGKDSPFRPWKVMRKYVQDMFDRRGYQDLVSYDTTVELAEKIGSEWKLTLRRNGEKTDHWWVEWFDAVVVASGHYSVPNIPNINGLVEAEKSRPGSVLHSKLYRGRDAFRGKVLSSRLSVLDGWTLTTA